MKVVIFCGGKGTRMGDVATTTPKPLIEINGKPIIERIMDHYAKYGADEFILCLGYLADKFKQHFSSKKLPYNVTLVDTGVEATKSQRLIAVKKYLGEEDFFVSYGDDIADIDIGELLKFHKKEGVIATLTCVRLNNPYGVVELDEYEPARVSSFKEKPQMKEWINGGYFVFTHKIFDYLSDKTELEKEVLVKLAKEKQLAAYRHPGFWRAMNTLKDQLELEGIFKK